MVRGERSGAVADGARLGAELARALLAARRRRDAALAGLEPDDAGRPCTWSAPDRATPACSPWTGARCLARADVVIYDYLASPRLLDHAPAHAERILVGKHGGGERTEQEEITALMLEHARAGRTVVRLKGGDPFVFGRGGEEAEALAAAGIPFEIVPGVTSAIAVPAYAGIPLTHRDLRVVVHRAHRLRVSRQAGDGGALGRCRAARQHARASS